MKTASKTAKIETAYGQTLASPLSFGYTFEELEKGDEIPAKEQPDADDLRTYVNQKRNSSARAAASTKALEAAGIQKPDLSDKEFQLKSMVKILVAAGNSQEVAEQIAKSALGL